MRHRLPRRHWSLSLGALTVALLAACNNHDTSNDSKGGPGPDAFSLFQIEAPRIQDHVYPSDVYLDRSFLPAQGVPLLATPTVRAAFGITEGQRIGGFSLAQAGAIDLNNLTVAFPGDANFLLQLGTTSQICFPSTTSIRIPFSNESLHAINETTINNPGTIQLYDLGVPLFNPTAPQNPPTLLRESALRPGDTVPGLLTILGGGADGNTQGGMLPARTAQDLIAIAATPVAVGEIRYNPLTGAINVRPREPFRPTSLAVDPTRLGLHTYAVVMPNGALVTQFSGKVLPSPQIAAVQASDLSTLPADQQVAVQRYLTDTNQGFALVSTASGLTRATAMVYNQFTIKDDTSQLQILREVINGDLQVDQRFVGGSATGTIAINTPNGISVAGANGFDGMAATTDDPDVITGAANIEAFFQRIFGPYSGTTATISTTFNLIGDATSVVTFSSSSLNGPANITLNLGVNSGALAGGTFISNPGAGNQASFPIISNTEFSITINGDVTSAVGGAVNQAVPFSALRSTDNPTAPFSGLPNQGIGTIIRGFFSTPNFRSFNFPANPFSTTAAPINPLVSQTFVGSGFVTAALGGGTQTQLLQAAVVPFQPTTNILAQFPQEMVDRRGAFLADPATLANMSLGGRRLANQLPYLLFVPSLAAPTGGYPVVVGIHGFGRRKEDLCAIAATITSAGRALLCIDIAQHGERQAQDGDNGAGRLVEGGAVAVPAAMLAAVPPRVPFPDPFIDPTLLARSRDRLRQSQVDLFSLLRALRDIGNTANPNVAFDPAGTIGLARANVGIVGQSLGGIMGTQISATWPDINRAVLNVPGGGLLDIIAESDEIAPSIGGLLLATANADADQNNPGVIFALLAGSAQRMTFNSGIREVYDVVAQSVVAPVDPLTYSRQAIAPIGQNLRTRRIFSGNPANFIPADPPAILVQYVLNDTVVPNSANSRLARGFAVGSASFIQLDTTNLSFPNPLNPTETLTQSFPTLFSCGLVDAMGNPRTVGTTPFNGSGLTQFPSTHGFLLNPGSNPVPTSAAQTQAATFFAAPVPTIP